MKIKIRPDWALRAATATLLGLLVVAVNRALQAPAQETALLTGTVIALVMNTVSGLDVHSIWRASWRTKAAILACLVLLAIAIRIALFHLGLG